MIGKLNPNSREVTIIGGGVSGLLACYYLTRAGYHVHLYEESTRWGGLIQTQSTPLGITEAAAHSLLVTPEVEKLFGDLGIELLEVNPHSRARWILRNGQMRQFPMTFSEAIRALFRSFWARSSSDHPLSLAEWTQLYLGQPALEYLVSPMLRGIFGASPHQILVNAAFPSLVVPQGRTLFTHLLLNFLKKRIATSSRSKPKMMAPKNGMESLIQSLKDHLMASHPERIHLDHPVRELPKTDNLILAVPPSQASKLLNSADPQLAQALDALQWASLSTATVFLEKSRIKLIPEGVGVLMPAVEGRKCLGILFNSSAFQHRVLDSGKWISLTIMLTQTQSSHFHLDRDRPTLLTIEAELNSLFGWSGPIEHYAITHWPHAIPLYDQNLVHAWNLARDGWCSQPGRILAGNYTGAVSIRGMIEDTARLAQLSPIQ